jgi:hypothetical protein
MRGFCAWKWRDGIRERWDNESGRVNIFSCYCSLRRRRWFISTDG